MIADGLAWHYVRYSKAEELAAAEREARAAGRGLWADPEPVPPGSGGRVRSSGRMLPPKRRSGNFMRNLGNDGRLRC